ncbi:NAD kinase 2, mitochondrial-like [Varroa jacobsoni]|uniref:NAD kinase 2, mitochondrial-like n=1 Tax=Varroa jacobsoni TaxID=62625 RepID=UPI000BF24F36|nr:NAD kinase 2, mitochondrial-like [Varroa jacobsoni]
MRLFCRTVSRAATAPLPTVSAEAGIAGATGTAAAAAVAAAASPVTDVFFARRRLLSTTTSNGIGIVRSAVTPISSAATSLTCTSTPAGSGRSATVFTGISCSSSGPALHPPRPDASVSGGQASPKPCWTLSAVHRVRQSSTVANCRTSPFLNCTCCSSEQFIGYQLSRPAALSVTPTHTSGRTANRHSVVALGSSGAADCSRRTATAAASTAAAAAVVLRSATVPTGINGRRRRPSGAIAGLLQQLVQVLLQQRYRQESEQQQQRRQPLKPLRPEQQLAYFTQKIINQEQQQPSRKEYEQHLLECFIATSRHRAGTCETSSTAAGVTGSTIFGQSINDLTFSLHPEVRSAMAQRDGVVSGAGAADGGVQPGDEYAGAGSKSGSAASCAGCNQPFAPKRVLVLTKFSRLEFEKRRHQELSEEELIRDLEARGSDYQSLLHHHNVHSRNRDLVVDTLRKAGLETRLVDRFEYTDANVEWADVIFTTGGDGTFLMAASKVLSRDKPVIGINSDPSRSVGYLCLPGDCTEDFPRALQKLLDGQFRWQWRQRIRVTVQGKDAFEAPIELHNQQLQYPEYRFIDCINEEHKPATPATPTHIDGATGVTDIPPVPAKPPAPVRILPIKSLNEVFVGESLSSRVSYYEISIDGSKPTKVKSSGVTMCTGTGSTSWSFNISKVTPQCVKRVLEIVQTKTGKDVGVDNQKLIDEVTAEFNDSLIFDPSEALMAYTIRDPVFIGTDFSSKPRGFAKRIEIRSRMFDACIVIDGSLSFIFNDGAIAVLEILEQDGLKTVAID